MAAERVTERNPKTVHKALKYKKASVANQRALFESCVPQYPSRQMEFAEALNLDYRASSQYPRPPQDNGSNRYDGRRRERSPRSPAKPQQVTRDQVTTLTTVLQGAVVEGGGRPVFIHCKDRSSGRAAQEALGCFRRVPGASALAVHWHFFTGSVEDIQAWRQLLPNLYVGGECPFSHSSIHEMVLASSDSSSLLLESDAPYVVPTGAGVGINSPWLMRHALWELASLRREDLHLLASQLNAKGSFLCVKDLLACLQYTCNEGMGYLPS
ncbi:hypothetical protein KP79_PYT23741 [Mizuhopecten yessoensis]|uniref:Uncharacterized protein n=1 Tax=Mizuhopecten yessoensis TaxID=6573 RepID=A0A210QLG3_MIZYE|nr:hypothetical protein KP79_PYT23741 [Mizuhopecten yessoensis]